MKQPILVKLKMKKIYKSSLTLIGLLFIIVTSLGLMYLFYDRVLDNDSDIEVNGALSINYIDGKKFNIESNSTKNIELSVSNASSNVNYYNIGFMQVRGTGTYKIIFEDKVVMEGDLKTIDEISTEYISIDAGETKDYVLEITNTSTDNLKGVLNIRNQNGKIITFSDTILKNVTPSTDSLTKVGDEEALEDEGLIKSSDDIGVTYYFRGNVQNNYVSFANLLWRIVRINGDGTIRLVLNEPTETISSYYTTDNPAFEFDKSNIKEFLETWYQDKLSDYTNYIANSKFCSDINADGSNTYLAYTRIMTNKIPTFNCLGTIINNNIGLLTVDEVILAGASPSSNNQSFYLYNSSIEEPWYTMSGAKGSDSSLNMFMVGINGNILDNISGNLYRNVRPVINLIKNIEMTGTGTISDPYRMIDN